VGIFQVRAFDLKRAMFDMEAVMEHCPSILEQRVSRIDFRGNQVGGERGLGGA
jgi:hypothetical protein